MEPVPEAAPVVPGTHFEHKNEHGNPAIASDLPLVVESVFATATPGVGSLLGGSSASSATLISGSLIAALLAVLVGTFCFAKLTRMAKDLHADARGGFCALSCPLRKTQIIEARK